MTLFTHLYLIASLVFLAACGANTTAPREGDENLSAPGPTAVQPEPTSTAEEKATEPPTPPETGPSEAEISALTKMMLIEHYKTGDLKKISAYLKQGADPNRRIEGRGPALEYSVRYIGREGVALMLDHGADPNQLFGIDDEPISSSVISAYKSRTDKGIAILNRLVEGGLKLVPAQVGSSMVTLGFDGNVPYLTWLLDHGVPADTVAVPKVARDPLDEALDKLDSITGVNGKGVTALMMASQMGRLEAVELLLKRGASAKQTDAKGWTALTYFRNIEQRHKEEAEKILQLLLEAE